MRALIIILVLVFSFQFWSKADDINDFEIEGISIGDSLLEHFSESKIKKQLSRTNSNYKDNYIKRVWFNISNSELYDGLNVHFINDKNYKIVSIGGLKFFENNRSECYKKMDTAINAIEKFFPKSEKSSIEINKHSADKSGKSVIRDMWFKLSSGQVYINCTDWSDNITKELSWTDEFGVYIETYELVKWLKDKAY
tara:strand:- start:774 stop:1361 length:588 start_codon:yes stop_codon:yes gene_type:complete